MDDANAVIDKIIEVFQKVLVKKGGHDHFLEMPHTFVKIAAETGFFKASVQNGILLLCWGQGEMRDTKQINSPDIKGIFRTQLARFAVVYKELTEQNISPYGFTGVFTYRDKTAMELEVEMQNTTDAQYIVIHRK